MSNDGSPQHPNTKLSLLSNLPNAGNFTTNTGVRAGKYLERVVMTENTSPPKNQRISTDETNILVRALQSRLKQDQLNKKRKIKGTPTASPKSKPSPLKQGKTGTPARKKSKLQFTTGDGTPRAMATVTQFLTPITTTTRNNTPNVTVETRTNTSNDEQQQRPALSHLSICRSPRIGNTRVTTPPPRPQTPNLFPPQEDSRITPEAAT